MPIDEMPPYAWLCVCGTDNLNVLVCTQCKEEMVSAKRYDAFAGWAYLVCLEERERIIRLLDDDVQINGNGAMMMEYIRSLIRGTNAD